MRAVWLPLLLCAVVGPAIAQTREGAASKNDPAQAQLTALELAKALNDEGSVTVRGIHFDAGTATLRPESTPLLAAIADVLKHDASLKLEIQGHVDNVGSRPDNLRLSQAQAAAVCDRLIRTFGIATDRLTAVGFGDGRPVATNATDEGRAQNRRVELVKIPEPTPTGPKKDSLQSGATEWTGRVSTGMMAIGGETTGIVLVTDGDQLELQPADQAMRQRLQDLNGKTVTVRGTLQTTRGVEIRTRRIIKVSEVHVEF
jgi:outer membrane protein OmpA-like peptidoglycan-associated protein